MRHIVSPFFRAFDSVVADIYSLLKIGHYYIRYPQFSVSGDTQISFGVRIYCSNNSKLVIQNSYIGPNTIIEAKHGGTILIKNSYIGPNCVIVATSSILIEDNCMIAEMVVIRDQNHSIAPGKSILQSPLQSAPIHIHENVWIGAKATVLKGVEIRENTIVGAHALVNQSLGPESKAVGIPARPINRN